MAKAMASAMLLFPWPLWPVMVFRSPKVKAVSSEKPLKPFTVSERMRSFLTGWIMLRSPFYQAACPAVSAASS